MSTSDLSGNVDNVEVQVNIMDQRKFGSINNVWKVTTQVIIGKLYHDKEWYVGRPLDTRKYEEVWYFDGFVEYLEILIVEHKMNLLEL